MGASAHHTDLELDRRRQDSGRGGDDAREALILRHTGLARSIAHRYTGKGLPFDDILQSGYIGLIQAVDRFDAGRGVPLERYAARMIEGEIMHLFRDRGWAVRMPRGLQESSRRVVAARDELAHRLGTQPTTAQLAAHLDEELEAVEEALAAGRAYRADRLDDPDGAEDERRSSAAATAIEPGYAHTEDRAQVLAAMSVLAPRERTIVMLRYYEELTQSEIAARMQISQMHVSRLLRASLETMADAAGTAA